MNNKKFNISLPLLFAAVMIIGMYIGYKLHASQPGNNLFAKNSKASVLQEAVSIIKSKYVDSLNTDSLQEGAIRDIMSSLDPHSLYLPPMELKASNEDLSGNFDGIGVGYSIVRDTVNVTDVIKDGPSDKAGVQIGDQILGVNGISLTGAGISTETIRNNIRGEKGSKATLQLLRNSQKLHIAVTRGSVPRPSIVASYMIDKNTGYIKFFDKFTETSYREFMQALESLKKQGMTSLIFDLRGNGGGYLDQAVEIVDEFLSGEKLIVYTQGNNSPRKEYRCKRPGLFETGKLVVVVDELSASATEIVAGAIQDWDRGTIVGRRTFGKGLVQETFDLDNGAALRLTVARYYTPLGRSIQKPYTSDKKVYMDEVWQRYSNGAVYFADSNKVNNGKAFKTPDGKTLYGGGGIMPDVFVGLDTSRASKGINKLFFNGSFNDFVFHYYLDNKSILQAYNNPQQYAAAFNPGSSMWQPLVNWAKRDTIDLNNIPAAEKQRLEDRMEAQLARFKWKDNGFYLVLNLKDPAVQKALTVLKTP